MKRSDIFVGFNPNFFFYAARSLGVVNSSGNIDNQKGHDLEENTSSLTPTVVDQDGVQESNESLDMDYTPARKKPPIHN